MLTSRGYINEYSKDGDIVCYHYLVMKLKPEQPVWDVKEDDQDAIPAQHPK